MRFSSILSTMITGLAGLWLAATPVNAQTVLNAEAGAPGGTAHVPLVIYADSAKDAGVGNIQIQDGATLTKAILNVATRKSDMSIIPGAAYTLLKNGQAMYSKMGEEEGAKHAQDLRAVFGYLAGLYIPLTFADSDVKSWSDFKGKNIFVGPPSGAAAKASIDTISAVTGFKPGEDYEEVRLDWGAAQQAMIDRKFDIYVRPATLPNPLLDQLIAADNIRLIGIPEDVLKSEEWKKAVSVSGRLTGTAKTSAYASGVEYVNAYGPEADKQISFMGYNMLLIAHKDVSEDFIYNATKHYFANMDKVEKATAFMSTLGLREAFIGLEALGIKLHPGAARAYEELGYDIPAALL